MMTKVSEHAIIVNDDNKVLILQGIYYTEDTKKRLVTNRYLLPGGRLDHDSLPGHSLLREIKEETALTNVRILMPVHNSIWGKADCRYSVIYLARCFGNEQVKIQENEAASYCWVSWDEAEKTQWINSEFLTAVHRARAYYSLAELHSLDFLNPPHLKPVAQEV